MKKSSIIAVFFALVLVLAANNVFAHDQGDMILAVDHQIGLAVPSLGLIGGRGMLPGLDLSLRGTFDYYFTDFFSLGIGLGYSCNYNIFYQSMNVDPIVYSIPIINVFVIFAQAASFFISPGYYFASYLTVPVGLRFSAKAFTFGAGATANFPLFGAGVYPFSTKNNDVNDSYNDSDYKDSNYDDSNYDDSDITFKLLTYLGWYVDLGFDLSGIKNKKGGFGMLVRVSDSFANEIAEPSRPDFKTSGLYGFYFVSTSLIFRASFELSNRPISGKKSAGYESIDMDY